MWEGLGYLGRTVVVGYLIEFLQRQPMIVVWKSSPYSGFGLREMKSRRSSLTSRRQTWLLLLLHI